MPLSCFSSIYSHSLQTNPLYTYPQENATPRELSGSSNRGPLPSATRERTKCPLYNALCVVTNRCTSQPRFFQLFLYAISTEGKHEFSTNVNREYQMIQMGRWENLDFFYAKVAANIMIFRIDQNLWMAHWIRLCFVYLWVKRIDVYIVNLFPCCCNTL